jgi:23S rRNA (adenine2503-C2)-methyltransferase
MWEPIRTINSTEYLAATGLPAALSYPQTMSVEGQTTVGLRDLTFEATRQRLDDAGVRPVHAAALWAVLYGDAAPANLPAPVRRWLETQAQQPEPSYVVSHRAVSTDGRTEKFLVRLGDGQEIETVIMGYPGRFTACISTQAGCAMGCVFCATGQMGFARHLTPREIVDQVRHVRRVLGGRGNRLRNVVLMGMGEPLHNYDHVMTALSIVTDPHGLGLGPARITVNTVGVVPAILRMADERQPYHLGVSLHGSTEEERAQLVPVSVRWPLSDLIEACRTYGRVTGRRVFFSWTLIAGVNDTAAHASRLAVLLRGLDAHVNLIHLNATPGFAGADVPDAVADTFRTTVREAGIACTIRQLRGIDVAAGCGQLTAERLRRTRSADQMIR